MTRSILIAVTHLLGVGHLSRAAALGRGLARAGLRVTLVSGGRSAPTVDTSGLDFVQLPAVHCRGVDFTRLLQDDGTPAGRAFLQERTARLVRALHESEPAIVVTETYPFGRRSLADEFRALVEAAAAQPSRPLILASIRDILNPPSKPERVGAANEILARWYDGVLVHGDEAVAPLAASWPDGEGLRRVLAYTGYVAGEAAAPAQQAGKSGEVLVSGGGSDASLPLFTSALEAAALVERSWRILVGHGVDEGAFVALASSAPANAVVERARPDFPALLAAAAASVSQAGYNTAIDLARAGVPAVLVPFEQGQEAEQRLRAECFARHGLASVVAEEELSGPRLAAAVEEALTRPRRAEVALDLDGIAGSLGAIDRHGRHRFDIEAAWAALDEALDTVAARHGRIDIWWRDDDAIAPTPALDRLLALSARLDVPVALAVVPAGAGGGLRERIAEEPLVDVLVHGFAHRNHAPLAAKKQELGFRDPDEIVAELAAGLRKLDGLMGERLVPVLVPPWNRIDPTLVARLPDLGFTGLSTFGRVEAPPAARAIATINTHLDPIDWKGGGGLADEGATLRRLARDLRAIASSAAEPVGILTHHLAHDPWIWAFTERLLLRLESRPDVRFAAIRNLVGRAGIASKDCLAHGTVTE